MNPYSLHTISREAQFVKHELAEIQATLYALRMRLAGTNSAIGHLCGALLAAEDAEALADTTNPGLDINDLTSWPRNGQTQKTTDTCTF